MVTQWFAENMKTTKHAGPIPADAFDRNEKGGPKSATLCRLSALLGKEAGKRADKPARGQPRQGERCGYAEM